MKFSKLCRLSVTVIIFFAVAVSFFFSSFAPKDPGSRPKLVVGIVVDQMRYDFLFRYWNKYSNNGFKRLVNEGFLCSNTQYNYFPTYTGPGHASIYTGTVPSIHGIVANDWCDDEGGTMYVTEDVNVMPVGTESFSCKMSPQNLTTTTITDQLRLSNNFQSKCIGIALKDRGAILPAGHTANAAYWFDGSTGNWVSSSYYMKELPKWVNDFNGKKLPAQYLSKDWTTLLPIDSYTESSADTAFYEEPFKGETGTAFPHHVPALAKQSLEVLKATPFGNSLTKDFAIETIKSENMGKGSVTDFLAVSFSSTDYVGHQFGPNSIETEDTYLRLDKDLAELLSFLDNWVGKENVLVFLTADHGIAPVPEYALRYHIPAGVVNEGQLFSTIKKTLHQQLGDSTLVIAFQNQQLYLSHEKMMKMNVTEEKLCDILEPVLMKINGVRNIFPSSKPEHSSLPSSRIDMMRNSFFPKRSGDIMILYEPFWIGGRHKGTTHGSIFFYDTHVPLLWYGWEIKNGSSSSRVFISDIAPTIADFLNIQEPNGCVGNPIEGLK